LANIINTDLRCVNGKTIYFPPWYAGEAGWGNMALPDVYLCDQVQQYPRGTKFVDGDRVFRYTLLGTAGPGTSSYASRMGFGLIGVNTASSVTLVTATSGTNTVTGAIATVSANDYADGWLSLYGTASDEYETLYRIISNTATTSSNVTFTLDHNLRGTYDSSDTCYVMKPMWNNLIAPGSTGGRGSSVGFEPFFGVLVASQDAAGTAIAAGDYTWVQTWGPCWMPASVAFAGATAQERYAYFMSMGDVQVADPAGSYNRFWCQRAGYLLPCTCTTPGTSTSGTDVVGTNHIIFLEISR
jgi:hypothetical protein